MKAADLITPGNARAHSRALRPSFPHMGPADAAVWASVLKLGLVEADRYEYDVRLGGLAAHAVEDSHELKPMWVTLLMKRVDVVAWTGRKPILIEVKPVASFAALGQCLGYAWLWRKENPGQGDPGMMCCCAYADPDLKPVFEAYGVSVVSLPGELASRLQERQGQQELR